MRQIFFASVALLLCLAAQAGVKRVGRADVDAQQSAALFIGIRNFDDTGIAPVPYAVDDAVDLAYEMTINHRPPLVPPNRAVLALSAGEPQKPESQRRLRELLAAGASRCAARSAEVLALLDALSRRVGRNGLLIVSLATHGISDATMQRLLTVDSRLDDFKPSLTDKEIGDIISRNDVPRSLILIDACRERLTRARSGRPDPRTAAARFKRVMMSIDGQVTMSAAAAGGYAYDDEVRRNGVFTAVVIDGLQCGAGHDWHGFITVETLHRYVSRHVLRWIHENKDRTAKKATQLSCEGESRKMPLSICVNRTAAASAPRPR
jgi:hypothetical protein